MSLSVYANMNDQIRMCGKGVGLVLFPSDSIEFQSNDFDEITYIKPLNGVE